jgi:hypothetical protein
LTPSWLGLISEFEVLVLVESTRNPLERVIKWFIC